MPWNANCCHCGRLRFRWSPRRRPLQGVDGSLTADGLSLS
jgi:hypothetical protein